MGKKNIKELSENTEKIAFDVKAEEISEDTLGKLIKKMRKSRGLTQPELAEGVVSDVSSICKWEKSGSPAWWKFIKIADFLGYEIEIRLVQKERYF